MNEQQAREILGKYFDGSFNLKERVANGDESLQTMRLDGVFTADELEAIAWWIRNKGAA